MSDHVVTVAMSDHVVTVAMSDHVVPVAMSGGNTLDPAGSEAGTIAGVWWILFAIAAFVAVVVIAAIVVGMLGRRRAQPLRPNRFVGTFGVAAPAVLLLVAAVVTIVSTDALRSADDEALAVDVIGRQFWWEVRYPDHGVVTANEIHVPQGVPIDLRLTSDDVIHSLWVPRLAGKVDMIPGQENHLRFEATETGTFWGACAEFCGVQHAFMHFHVVVEPAADFQAWIAARTAPAAELESPLARRGRDVFAANACAGCHSVATRSSDDSDVNDAGPPLGDLGARQHLAAGVIENTPDNLAAWIADPDAFKPGSKMPAVELSADELDAIVAYLESLP